MKTAFQIALIPKNKMEDILPLVQALNSNTVSLDILKKRLENMLGNGYQCLGVYDNNKIIGICGIWVLEKFYVGKHIEPDNVFILPEYRSSGVGKGMLNWIFNYAREIGCDASEVNCYLKNERGFQFWKNQGYDAIGYHMQKVF
ncbi:MAG: GNAT family N-acetyltransferase [Flavobacteriaceae bacterium]|nr:GNAT family N-acetyltransferase [Flavobacteriaceae bacterium]MDZ4147273.1 GNAT family N-acetyltransferase [Flavobacteriaceae bacterium]